MSWFHNLAVKLIKNPFGVFSLLFFTLVTASALAGFSPSVDDYVLLNASISELVPAPLFWATMFASGIAGTVGILMTRPKVVTAASMLVVIGHSFVFFTLIYTDHITSQAIRSPWIVIYAAYIFFVVGLRKSWWD